MKALPWALCLIFILLAGFFMFRCTLLERELSHLRETLSPNSGEQHADKQRSENRGGTDSDETTSEPLATILNEAPTSVESQSSNAQSSAPVDKQVADEPFTRMGEKIAENEYRELMSQLGLPQEVVDNVRGTIVPILAERHKKHSQLPPSKTVGQQRRVYDEAREQILGALSLLLAPEELETWREYDESREHRDYRLLFETTMIRTNSGLSASQREQASEFLASSFIESIISRSEATMNSETLGEAFAEAADNVWEQMHDSMEEMERPVLADTLSQVGDAFLPDRSPEEKAREVHSTPATRKTLALSRLRD